MARAAADDPLHAPPAAPSEAASPTAAKVVISAQHFLRNCSDERCADDVGVSCPGLPAWPHTAYGCGPKLSKWNSQNLVESLAISGPTCALSFAFSQLMRLPLFLLPMISSVSVSSQRRACHAPTSGTVSSPPPVLGASAPRAAAAAAAASRFSCRLLLAAGVSSPGTAGVGSLAAANGAAGAGSFDLLAGSELTPGTTIALRRPSATACSGDTLLTSALTIAVVCGSSFSSSESFAAPAEPCVTTCGGSMRVGSREFSTVIRSVACSLSTALHAVDITLPFLDSETWMALL